MPSASGASAAGRLSPAGRLSFLLRPRWTFALVALACVVPRLAALLYARGDILTAFTEKSDDFARIFLAHGTFGLVPGQESAYTQPLYAFFLIPIYWVFGRNWEAVGLAQILVALVAALVVAHIGRRWLSPLAGLLAGVVTALHPYLIWHDVHLNREILDTALAAGAVALALSVSERPTKRRAAALGFVLGLAVLSNTRLLLIPVVVALFVVAFAGGGRRRALVAALVVIAASAAVVLPWAVRNAVEVGCFTITTDSKALWKANNVNTYAALSIPGRWIDDVAVLPNAAMTTEEAGAIWATTGKRIHVDECAQSSLYQSKVFEFWQQHPGEKLKLAGQAGAMLWNPRAFETSSAERNSSAASLARRWVVPAYMIPLYLLAAIGVFVVPRRLAVLAVGLLAYNTLAATIFAGATRYRVPFDFLLALLATGAVQWLVERRRGRPAGARMAVGAPGPAGAAGPAGATGSGAATGAPEPTEAPR